MLGLYRVARGTRARLSFNQTFSLKWSAISLIFLSIELVTVINIKTLKLNKRLDHSQNKQNKPALAIERVVVCVSFIQSNCFWMRQRL